MKNETCASNNPRTTVSTLNEKVNCERTEPIIYKLEIIYIDIQCITL